jgi:hypothetical protein
MFRRLLGLFRHKPSSDILPDNVKLVTDYIGPDHMSLVLTISVDVASAPNNALTINVKQMSMLGDNDLAKKFISTSDSKIVKDVLTIIALASGKYSQDIPQSSFGKHDPPAPTLNTNNKDPGLLN